MLHVGHSDLGRAFRHHLQAARSAIPVAHSPSRAPFYLLLFYATECGLKQIYLRRNRLRTTAQIQDETLLSESGHDLLLWLKELRAPAAMAGKAPSFRPAGGGSARGAEQAHQAWRYGYRMIGEDESALHQWLDHVCHWIEGQIGEQR